MSLFSWRNVVIGILATISMDVLSVTALKLGWIAFLPPRLTGRWFASMARGQFVHSDIGPGAAHQSRNGGRGSYALRNWDHPRACLSTR